MKIVLQVIRYFIWALAAVGIIALRFVFEHEEYFNHWGELTWYYILIGLTVLLIAQMALIDKKTESPRAEFLIRLLVLVALSLISYLIADSGLINIPNLYIVITAGLIIGLITLFSSEFIERHFKEQPIPEVPVIPEAQRKQNYLKRIDETNRVFDSKNGSIRLCIYYINGVKFNGLKRQEIKKGDYNDSIWRSVPEKICAKLHFTISRSLSSMSYRELEACRILRLAEICLMNQEQSYNLNSALIWADGKGNLDAYNYTLYKREFKGDRYLNDTMVDSGTGAFEWFAKNVCDYQNFDSALSALLKIITFAQVTGPEKIVLDEINRRLEAGNAWLDSGQFDGTGFSNQNPQTSGLFLGKMPDNRPCWFTGEGSVITVAPPGSGKTQTHVIPNLLNWNGPAVILDVKGELWDKTAGRRAELGPVYKFSPLDPGNSHSFNPLTLIRNHPDYIWEDCKYLADLMVVASETKDPFWENRARDLITAAIAVECLKNDPVDRDMANVVGYCYGRDWTKMLATLCESPVNAMKNAAEGWINATGSSEKTLDGIRQQAQTFMSAWEGSRVERATRQSDWHPLDLRRGDKPVTLYISLKAGEIDAYASLLRVFIGTQIRSLIQDLPQQGSPDILFMLDELPRLKYMSPIEEALELGRQYGLKLFMVIQSIGQLKKHYKNADGLMGSCAVQAYMNPASNDGTAEHLTKILGQIESIVDGSRRQLVEISDLTGPEFKDKVLILSSGAKPIKANKAFAYQDDRLAKWMNQDPPSLDGQDKPAEETELSTKGVY